MTVRDECRTICASKFCALYSKRRKEGPIQSSFSQIWQ